jgi:hypothetical protein
VILENGGLQPVLGVEQHGLAKTSAEITVFPFEMAGGTQVGQRPVLALFDGLGLNLEKGRVRSKHKLRALATENTIPILLPTNQVTEIKAAHRTRRMRIHVLSERQKILSQQRKQILHLSKAVGFFPFGA